MAIFDVLRLLLDPSNPLIVRLLFDVDFVIMFHLNLRKDEIVFNIII